MKETSTTEEAVLYCANHPNRETLLRCNKCGKPICMQCAQLTDVGYRCKECIRTQQNVYFNAESWDNPIALVVSFLVALIVTPIVGAIFSFSGLFGWIFAFILGPSAGGLLSQIIRGAVGRRRGRYLGFFAIGGVLLGMLAGGLLSGILSGFGVRMGVGLLFFNLPVLIFAFLAATTAYQILR
ncbi:MAG: B-box zinc finger protein [Caldilineaceae bacterium]